MIAALWIFQQKGFAFDTETHAAITEWAFQNSVLSSTKLGSASDILGLNRLNRGAPFWISTGALRYSLHGGTHNVQSRRQSAELQSLLRSRAR